MGLMRDETYSKRLLAAIMVVLAGTAYLATCSSARAGDLTLIWVGTDSMPNVSELNSNFSAIETSVDDNDNRIDGLLSAVACTEAGGPCDLEAGTTIGGAAIGTGGGGAPTTADYLVGTADAGLSAEIVVGAAVANQFVTGVSGGAVTRAQPAFSDVSGTATDLQVNGLTEADEVVGTETDEALCTWEATGSRVDCDLAIDPGTDVNANLEEETHASEHQNGGGDEVATATPGANVIPKAGAGGFLADAFVDGSLEENEIDLLDLLDTAAADTCLGDDYVKRNAGDTAFECLAAPFMTSFTLFGDDAGPGSVVTDTNVVFVVGDASGIDTDDGDAAIDSVTISYDPTEAEAGNEGVIDLADLQGDLALGTKTSGNYALGDAEGGAATTGDSATGFFASGTLEDALINGAGESDEVTGLTDGQISDTLTASTSTLAAANTNTTALATTSFVQQEIDDADLLSDNCALENDSTPIPDSCVGDGSDAGGGGGGNSVEQSIAISGGSGFFSQAVTGQAWVTTSSEIVCTPLGTTADSLTPEAIAIGGLQFSVSDRSAGVGFNINVYSPNGLEGTVRAHCVGV